MWHDRDVSEADETRQGFQVPLVWAGADRIPLIAANQFMVQAEPGEIFLTIGTLTPPVILADDEESFRAQAAGIDAVPIQVVGRYAMNRRRLVQLRNLLTKGIEIYDQKEAEDQ